MFLSPLSRSLSLCVILFFGATNLTTHAFSILDYINGEEALTKLKEIINPYKDLKKLLDTVDQDNPNNFTLFAPSDAAFQSADIDFTDPQLVNATLHMHIVPSTIKKTDLTGKHILTSLLRDRNYVRLEDDAFQVLDVRSDKESVYIVSNGGKKVFVQPQKSDIECANGVVHVLDDVVAIPDTFKNAISSKYSWNATKFAEVLTLANFADQINDYNGMTVFLPSDDALEGKMPQTPEEAMKMINSHVVFDNVVYSTQPALAGGAIDMEPLGDIKLSFVYKEEGMYVQANDVRASLTEFSDVLVANGVVHQISSLLPSSSSSHTTSPSTSHTSPPLTYAPTSALTGAPTSAAPSTTPAAANSTSPTKAVLPTPAPTKSPSSSGSGGGGGGGDDDDKDSESGMIWGIILTAVGLAVVIVLILRCRQRARAANAELLESVYSYEEGDYLPPSQYDIN